MHKKTGETPTRKNRIVKSRQRAAAATTTDRWGSDKTCTTHDVRAVTSAGQNDRRSYRSAVHRGQIYTTKDDETIVSRSRQIARNEFSGSHGELEEPGRCEAGKDYKELRS